MASLDVLRPYPQWRSKAGLVSNHEADQFLLVWQAPSVFVDDDCPLNLSVIVVDEDSRVFRIIDPELVDQILRDLGWSQPQRLFSIFAKTAPYRI